MTLGVAYDETPAEAAVAAGATPVAPGAAAPPVPVPAVTAPDFDLPDHLGRRFRLADALAGGRPVVVVFYRGHWCPYCRRYLAKLQANWPRFQAAGVTLVAVSPEPPATSAALAAQLGLSFPLLSDPGGAVIDRYGTRNGFAATRTLLPHPSVFVIDPAGTVRLRSIDRNYKKRTTVRAIFAAIDEVAGPNGEH